MTEEEIKHRGHDSEQGYEHQDLSPNVVFAFLGGLAVAGILIYFVVWGFYDVMDAYERHHQPPQNPLVQQTEADTRVVQPDAYKKFPQPRLERNERLEINDFRLQEEQTLNSYGWVDEKAGVVRIPIEHAMQLIAQRGLSTTPRAGAIPSAEGSGASPAAQPDNGNPPKGRAKK